MEEEKPYFETFQGNDQNLYGLRIGDPKDAKEISQIYEQVYGKNYLYPTVYKIQRLKESLANERKYWFVGDYIGKNEREVFGSGLLEKRTESTLYASKAVIREKYRGKGLASVLTSRGILSLLKRSDFESCIRFDADVRAANIHAQRLLDNVRAIPYAFNPIFYNYGNRLNHSFNDGTPYCKGYPEPAILYMFPFGKLWEMRESSIFLLEQESIEFMYDYIQARVRKMRHDEVILKEREKGKFEGYTVKKNLYMGILQIKGYLSRLTLEKLSKYFKDWRIIDWRIPATEEGLYSMKIALEFGFKVIGYDIGSYPNKNDTLNDCIVTAYFPRGIKFTQYEQMNIQRETIPLVNQVLDSLGIRYRVRKK